MWTASRVVGIGDGNRIQLARRSGHLPPKLMLEPLGQGRVIPPRRAQHPLTVRVILASKERLGSRSQRDRRVPTELRVHKKNGFVLGIAAEEFFGRIDLGREKTRHLLAVARRSGGTVEGDRGRGEGERYGAVRR